MPVIPDLPFIFERFNKGCTLFDQAINAFKNDNIVKYDTERCSAIIAIMGSLEWAFKYYLETCSRDKTTITEKKRLKSLNFPELMKLMRKYSTPPLKRTVVDALGDYKYLRNLAEHRGIPPSSTNLFKAINQVHGLLLTYLPLTEPQLKTVNEPSMSDNVLQELKTEYFTNICAQYKYMDLSGISPRAGHNAKLIETQNLFVPPQVTKVSHSGKVQLVDFFQVLEKPHAVVLGSPGSGKTMISKSIVYLIAQGLVENLKNHTPVFIRAIDYATALNKDPSLSIYEYITKKHLPKFGDLYERALQDNLCLIIIDGLDEISEPVSWVRTVRKIEQFVTEFHTNRVLVTSRIGVYGQSSYRGFSQFTLKDFGEAKIKEFLEQWYYAVEDETTPLVEPAAIERKALDLWEAINSNSNIRQLAGNPLLLTIIALIHGQGKKLPSRRVELYQIITETLVEHWPLTRKEQNLLFDPKNVLVVLEPIAHEILKSGETNRISEYDLLLLLETQISKMQGTTPAITKNLTDQFLKEIKEKTGFFIEKEFDQYSQSIYGFFHRTFAEYLTARDLANLWSSGELELATYAHDPRWHEVLLLMAGHIGTCWGKNQLTRLVNDVLALDSQHEEYLHRDLSLAAEMLVEGLRVDPKSLNMINSRLIFVALNTPYMPLWESTVHSLATIAKTYHPENLVPQFQLQATDSFELRVRKSVLLAMMGIHTDEVLTAFFQGFIETKNTHFLVAPFLSLLLDALDRITGQDEKTHLLSIDSTFEVHEHYLSEQTARRIAGLQFAFSDIHTLLETKGPMESNGGETWLLDMHDLFELDPSKVATSAPEWTHNRRFQVEEVFGNWKVPLPLYEEFITQALSRDTVETCLMALSALEVFLPLYDPEQQSIEPLYKWMNVLLPLTADNNPDIRSNTVKVLCELLYLLWDQARLTQLILSALNDSHETVRSAAVKIIFKYNLKSSTPVLNKLKELLEDNSPEIRQTSARVLINQEFEEEEVINLLRARFQHPLAFLDEESLVNGLNDLFRLASKVYRPGTIEKICNQLQMVLKIESTTDQAILGFPRSELLPLGAEIPREELMECVSKFFSSTNQTIRRRAIALWTYLRPDSTPPKKIIPILREPDPQIRSNAIFGLHNTDLQHPVVVDAIICHLIKDNPILASFAAYLLSGVQEKNLQQRIFDQVIHFLKQNPENKYAYEVLWMLMAPISTKSPYTRKINFLKTIYRRIIW